MTGGMAMFQSELRSAVRDARDGPGFLAAALPAPTPRQAAPQAGSAGQPAEARPRGAAPAKRTIVRLWLPLTPLWLVLSPFALLLAPVLAFVPATRGVPPYRAALAMGSALIALSGTTINVDTRDAVVRIRIF